MKRARPLVVSLLGLGLGVAGCDTVSTTSVPGPGPRAPMPVLPHDASLLILGLSFAALVLLVASVAWRAIAHDRLARRLRRDARPSSVAGRPVGLVPGDRVALVAGLRRPTTFFSRDVVAALSDAELAAVALHEWHHELHHAPATLVTLQGVASISGWVRPVARWAERVRARMEIDADAHALARGSSRQEIASAILKLADPSMPAGTAGFSSAVDLRLQALLREDAPPARTWRDDVVLASVLATAVVVVCSALSL